MTRFVSPDLSALGDLPLVAVSYEATEATRVDFYTAALRAHDIAYDVEGLESDPYRIAYSEGGAYPEILIDQRINEAMRSLSLATARGDALDHIGATYYGISRAVDVGDDGSTVTEADDRFRQRIALAPEAFSTAGPEGGYLFHVLELDGEPDIADAAVYSEEDAVTYSATLHADAWSEGERETAFAGRNDGDPVLAPEVLIAVLPTEAYGAADASLLSRAYKAATARDVRPIGDNIRIEAAEVVDYAVEMVVTYRAGADPTPLIAEARARVERYVTARRRVGLKAERLGIGGAGYVSGVESVAVASPTSDVGGGSKQAPHCTSITITAVQSEGSWQS